MTAGADARGAPDLDAMSRRLGAEFASLVDMSAIAEVVKTSQDLLNVDSSPAGRANTDHIERFARERLLAMAKSDGKLVPAVPAVLFLCVRNAGRSQMALAWFRRLAGDRALAWSGGSEPGSALDPNAVAAMDEVGLDISGEFPKPWTPEIVRGADLVVTMGCGDACPVVPGQRYEDWALPDPAGQPIEEVRPIRDEIGRRVEDLVTRLGVRDAG